MGATEATGRHAAPAAPAHIDPRWQDDPGHPGSREIFIPAGRYGADMRVSVRDGEINAGGNLLTPAEAETLVQVLAEAQVIAERQISAPA